MFTGIIEATGLITKVQEKGTNRTFTIHSALATGFRVDQSVSHDGVCLTVEHIAGEHYQVTAISETLAKTTLGSWKTGQTINLEQCLQYNGRLDGHIVQGHVDATGECVSKTAREGSWEYVIRFPENFAPLVIEKGSICLNGISLTIFNVSSSEFTIAIIPYTYNNTNIRDLEPSKKVNLEFDVIGKYILRKIQLEGSRQVALH
jgi:riboflavin synthase